MLTVISLLLSINFLDAQTVKGSKGKDFWLTFIPNFHNNKYSQNPLKKYLDTLNIYIAAEKPTKGIISYRDINNKLYTRNFEIRDTNQIFRCKLHYRDFELEGFNDNGRKWARNQCEMIAHQSFHITSENDVSVYALNQATYTSDAFLVFPTNVLGEVYYILSYNGDGTFGANSSRTPSQFAIVATEDSTKVEITPSSPTYVNGKISFSVVLNKGDVYLVQSAFDKGFDNPDLTGSLVEADKPIAVFSGHQRAKIPIDMISSNPSRDILVEQLQPYKNWGKNAFIIPLVQPYNITNDGTDLFRIVAAKDSTNIFLNGEYIRTINSGEFFEAPADKIFVINSNNPISVAQYKKTSRNFGIDLNISDPYMLIIPPKEQYLSSYRIISTESWDYNSENGFYPAFTEHYISLIVPDTAINSIVVDGNPIEAKKFKPIPGSKYYYVNYPTYGGVHSVYGSAPFGIYMSGFGKANSYGYLGGMNFIQLNFRPPKIFSSNNCSQVTGTLKKFSRTDYGIWSVIVDSSYNVNVLIDPFQQGDSLVAFNADLIDYRSDGSFKISVNDSLGNSRHKNIFIPGFTAGLISNTIPDSLLVVEHTVRPHSIVHGYFDILNYGRYELKINRVWFNNNAFTVISSQNFVLSPRLTSRLQYTFSYDILNKNDTVIIDTIKIKNDCFVRPIAIVKITVKGDTNSPGMQIMHPECDTMSVVTFSETESNDFGLMSYEVVNKVNCDVRKKFFNYQKLILEIIQINKQYDAYFTIRALDSAGNVRTLTDTIFGNNLFIEFVDSNNIHSFGEKIAGFLWCDSLLIHNTSSKELRIDAVDIKQNIDFSFPLSQFPFIVPSGESKSLFACFKPGKLTKEIFRDTVSIILDCIEQTIILEGKVKSFIRTGQSQCGADINLITVKVPRNFFIDNICPNPVPEIGKINIAIPKESDVLIKIYDILGREQFKLVEFFKPGMYELNLDLSQLKSGVYFFTIIFGGQIYTSEFRKI